MNALIRSLAEACRNHRLEQKVFVAPSYRIGHQLSEAVVLDGTNYANLRVQMLFGLALDVVNMRLTESGISVISDMAMLSLIEDLFRRKIYQKERLYFGELEPKVGIISALSRALGELRLCAVRCEDLKADQFVSGEKFEAIRIMMRGFEEHLAQSKTIDQAGVFQLAVDALPVESSSKNIWLIHPRLSLQELPRRFLDKLTGGKYVVLDSDPVIGSKPSRQLPYWNTDSSHGESQFSWIAVPQDCPKSVANGPVDFFHAIGKVNEVKEILRRINYGRLPLDSVEVACTDYSTYASIFFLERQNHSLNFTFAEGIPSTFTDPGKALLGFLDWIESDFGVTELRSLLSANVLVRNDIHGTPGVSSQEIIRILRRAKIGWGRDRYPLLLESLAKEDEKRAPTAQKDLEESERSPEWYLERAKRVRWVMEYTRGLLGCAPETGYPDNVEVGNSAMVWRCS